MTALIATLVAISVLGWLFVLGLAVFVAIVLWCIGAAIWDGWKESRQGRTI